MRPGGKMMFSPSPSRVKLVALQWELRFKRAEFKRIGGLREVKIAWHTLLLNRTAFLLNRITYPPPPLPIVAQLKT